MGNTAPAMNVIFPKEINVPYCISQNGNLLVVTKTASNWVLTNKLFCAPLVTHCSWSTHVHDGTHNSSHWTVSWNIRIQPTGVQNRSYSIKVHFRRLRKFAKITYKVRYVCLHVRNYHFRSHGMYFREI